MCKAMAKGVQLWPRPLEARSPPFLRAVCCIVLGFRNAHAITASSGGGVGFRCADFFCLSTHEEAGGWGRLSAWTWRATLPGILREAFPIKTSDQPKTE